MVESIVLQVDGFALHRDEADGAFRMRDIDLADFWARMEREYAGEQLKTVEHFEVALATIKDMPLGAMVVRAADGVVLSIKTTPRLTTRKRGAA